MIAVRFLSDNIFIHFILYIGFEVALYDAPTAR